MTRKKELHMKNLFLIIALIVLVATPAFAGGYNGDPTTTCIKESWPKCDQYKGTPQFDVCLKPYADQCRCKYWDKATLKKLKIQCGG